MEPGITSRRLWVGLALEILPIAILRLGLLFESAWWRRSDLLYNVGFGLLLISLISGVGWIVVGHPAAALAVFAWRALFVTIMGAALWMDGHRGAPLWWWAQFGWFAVQAFPAVSALLLWRWVQSVERDDFSDGAIDGAPDTSP